MDRSHLKIAAWNIERGVFFDGVLRALQTHPLLSQADIWLLTEVDVGMARSGNRHVAAELARELNLHGVFGPAYLNLDKGNSAEARRAEGENTVALQGHAILSRYPIDDVELVRLPATEDHVAGRERQIGAETAVVATVQTPHGPVHCVSTHLSLRSSRVQRRKQMETILKALRGRKGPAIIGGDWNTTTYSSNRAVKTIVDFWIRVTMGVRYVARNHYPQPERFFERRLFRRLEREGYSVADFNISGGCTVHLDVNDPHNFQMLGDWIPHWCFKYIRWALRKLDGVCSFKLDWFAARGLRGDNAAIVCDLPRGAGRYSDHDPILVDVRPI